MVIGADWPSGTDYADTLPEEGALPDGADALNGADEKCMDIYRPYQWSG